MKTKLHLLLLAALSLSAAPLHAGLFSDPLGICGGADDDQFHLPPPPPAPVLCGGADDDQVRPPGTLTPDFDALWNEAMGVPEHKGMTTDPLGIPPPQHQPVPLVQQLDGMPTSEIIAILIGLHGDDGSDTLRGLESDPLGLWGDNGTDSITGDGGADTIVGGGDADSVVGGDGADFNNPAGRDRLEVFLLDYLLRRPDFMVQICRGNGNDSLWGGCGTDELREKPIDRPLDQ
jgi:hypothetical protein